MKIKMKDKVIIEKEIDVDFPIYRKHDVMSDYNNCVIYSKIANVDNELTLTSITLTDYNQVEIEIINNHEFDGSSIDYHLGLGEYKSSEKEFKWALSKAQTLLDVCKE